TLIEGYLVVLTQETAFGVSCHMDPDHVDFKILSAEFGNAKPLMRHHRPLSRIERHGREKDHARAIAEEEGTGTQSTRARQVNGVGFVRRRVHSAVRTQYSGHATEVKASPP